MKEEEKKPTRFHVQYEAFHKIDSKAEAASTAQGHLGRTDICDTENEKKKKSVSKTLLLRNTTGIPTVMGKIHHGQGAKSL